MGLSLVITDADRMPVTAEIPWVTLQAEPKFNEVGVGLFTANPTAALLDAATTPGNRVRLTRGADVFLSGPIETPEDLDFDANGPGLLTVQWAGSEAAIAGELVYPDPAVAASAGWATEAWTMAATQAETVMRTAVNLNVGPGALAPRQVPGLTLGPALGVGTVIDAEARMTKLGDALRTWAAAGGGLGWRVRETVSGLLFEVWDPTDYSATIKFSFGLNNLRTLKVRREAPKGTVFIRGDDQSGTARTFTETVNVTDAAWGRRELFVNNDDVNAAIAEDAAQVTLIAEGVDTPRQMFGTDFDLGDIVGIEDQFGRVFGDIVTAAKLTADAATDPDGTVVVSIGTGHRSSDAARTDQLRHLTREVDRLMRS